MLMNMKRKKVKKNLIILFSLVLVFAVILVLFSQGVIWFNNPSLKQYPVRGVDVSAHQGKIDWQAIAAQDIYFAFIKATEGNSFIDDQFQDNWENARSAGIIVGAYHFFSYESPGKSQAENFINTVPHEEYALPPVVDIEFYGSFEKQPMEPEEARLILDELLETLYEYYHVKPIIYATMKSYELYLADFYEEYPIWIRNVYTKPVLSDGREWVFWQYSHKGRLNGYSGKEKFIDLNVFNGSKEYFNERFCLEQ